MKLHIGKPVKKIKNSFVLAVHYMHGDADAYSKKEFIYEKAEDIESFLPALDKLTHCDRYSADYQSVAKENKAIDEFLIHDASSEVYFAEVQYYKITYFDENGIEYEVRFE